MCFASDAALLSNDNVFDPTHPPPTHRAIATLDLQFREHYAALKRIAQSRIHRNGCDVAIDSAAVVNDCYLKLREANVQLSGDRVAFLAYASQAMRSVIVDATRQERTQRRGGGYQMVALDSLDDAAEPVAANDGDTTLAYDIRVSINAMARTRPRVAQIVASLYVRESTIAELADAFSLNERTIRRGCNEAKAMLASALS